MTSDSKNEPSDAAQRPAIKFWRRRKQATIKPLGQLPKSDDGLTIPDFRKSLTN